MYEYYNFIRVDIIVRVKGTVEEIETGVFKDHAKTFRGLIISDTFQIITRK